MPSTSLLFFLVVVITLTSPSATQPLHGFTLPLIHSHHNHHSTIQSSGNNTSNKLIFDNHQYLMELYVGTPSTKIYAIADTGSSLIWTQCLPCKHCYKQTLPIFNSTKSFTYKRQSCHSPSCQDLGVNKVPCNNSHQLCEYVYDYGDGSYGTKGTLSYDKFYWGQNYKTMDIGYLSFGCSDDITTGVISPNTAGIVGLGRNAISFVSQLRYKRFAYCLASNDQGFKSSNVYFGSHALTIGAQVPLVKGNFELYYLTLQGISIGNKTVSLPDGSFDITEDGEGGFFIDSGSSYTFFREESHDALLNAIRNVTSLPQRNDPTRSFELCFQSSSEDLALLPSITLHFYGTNLTLPKENTYVKTDNGVRCLAITKSLGSFSVLGTTQTQNFYVGYDLEAGVVSFAPVNCATFKMSMHQT